MLQKLVIIIFLVGLLLCLVGFSFGPGGVLETPVSPPGPNISPALPALPSFQGIRATAIISTYLPIVLKGTASSPNPPVTILEPFEDTMANWQVFADTTGGGSIVEQSSAQAAAGSYSAHLTTSSSGGTAQVRVAFSEPAGSHSWQERPGTWYWQWARVYLPSSTVAQLGPSEYLTLAGLWPSAGSAGWWLRVRQGGELYVYGFDGNGSAKEFRVYGTFPQDRWVAVELGLHSQNGPGVKRAFALLLDGDFYGWYHQGRLTSETYNRAAMGILSSNSNDSLEVFVDEWAAATTANLPAGMDKRSTDNVQEQNFRDQSGVQWQIDWSTWGNNLQLHPTYGLYSVSDRLQSGRNLDRMPDLTSGWAEIEIDWPNGTPPTSPSSYFGPMVGFRKEINREQNLEVIPIGQGGGNVNLAFEAWIGSPVIQAQWQMPVATTIPGSSRIPEPGDIIRTRWEQVNSSNLKVQASFYDASTNVWYNNIINTTLNVTNIGGVNYTDGFHTASSITIDSPYYSIRRFKVGTLETYP